MVSCKLDCGSNRRSTTAGHLRGRVARALLAATLIGSLCAACAGGGRLELNLVDGTTGKPVAANLYLRNAAGVAQRVKRWPFFHDHLAVEGRVVLDLKAGEYEFELERGPEYPVTSGHFSIADFADDKQTITLSRVADLAAEGWWSADLHVHRPLGDIELLMRAADLHLAPVISWWNEKNQWAKKRVPSKPLVSFDGDRVYHALGGEDERAGGALLFFNLERPLDLAGARPEYPSGLTFARQARQQPAAWVEAEKPFWWDFPLWVAHGAIDSVGLAHNHLQRGVMLDNEATGRARNRQRFPGAWGNALWTQEIYYQLLESGLRLPPTAGSASGVLHNPVGYNRAYVFLPGEFSWTAWWNALRAGRVMVTNGPLLRVKVTDQRPGQVFSAEQGPLELPIEIQLATRDPLRYLEVVQNGQVVETIPLQQGQGIQAMPVVRFDASGWFLVRVISAVEPTYRFASTGPFYVELAGQSRVSRRACQFFFDWTVERRAAVELTHSQEAAEVDALYQTAEDFWRARRDAATVD